MYARGHVVAWLSPQGVCMQSELRAALAPSVAAASTPPPLPERPDHVGVMRACQELSTGTVVEVAGIVSRPTLNGRTGTVLGLDEPTGRHMVDFGETFGCLKLKPANLVITSCFLNIPAEMHVQVADLLMDDSLPCSLKLRQCCRMLKIALDPIRVQAAKRRLAWMAAPDSGPPRERSYGAKVGVSTVPRWRGPAELRKNGLAQDCKLSANQRKITMRQDDGAGWVAGPPLPADQGTISWSVSVSGEDIGAYVGVSDETWGIGWGLSLADMQLRCFSRRQHEIGFKPGAIMQPPGTSNIPGCLQHERGAPPPPGFPNGFGVQVADPLPKKATDGAGFQPIAKMTESRIVCVGVVFDANAGALSFRVNGGPLRAALDGFPRDAVLRPWGLLQGACVTMSEMYLKISPYYIRGDDPFTQLPNAAHEPTPATQSAAQKAETDKAMADFFAKLQGDVASGRGIPFASIGGGERGKPLEFSTGRFF